MSTEIKLDIREVDLKDIVLNSDLQVRVRVNDLTVTEYKEAIEDGVVLPPVVLFQDDSKKFWVADGNHRIKAARECESEQKTIKAEVRRGSKRDALRYALGANSSHGLPRTNEDKHRAVNIALSDSEWSQYVDAQIARLCGVSDRFVAKKRKKHPATPNRSELEPTTRTYERNGKVQDMNVSAIGKKQVRVSATDDKANETSVVEPQTPVPTIVIEKAPIRDSLSVDTKQSTQAPVPTVLAKEGNVRSLTAAIEALRVFVATATDEEISSVKNDLYSIEKLIKAKLATLDYQEEK